MARETRAVLRAAGLAVVLPIILQACGSTSRPTAPTQTQTAAPAEAVVPASAPAVPLPAASPARPSPAASASAAPDLEDWELGRTIAAPGQGQLVYAYGNLYVVNREDGGFTDGVPNGEIYVIDPATGTLAATIRHARGGFPAAGEGAIWLINAEFGETVTRVDARDRSVQRFRTSGTEEPVPEAVVVAGGSVWVGNNHDGTVARVDPRSLKVTKTIRLTDPGAFGVRGKAATDGTSVWFGISRTGEIVRINAATAEVTSRIQLPHVPHDRLPPGFNPSDASDPEQLVVVGDRLYASTFDHIYAIDVSTIGGERIVADIPTPSIFATVLTPGGDGEVWALVHEPLRLLRIDAATAEVRRRIPLNRPDEPATDLVAAAGSLWMRYPDGLVEIRPTDARP